jgi:TrmH family RNA methyltransferase
VITSRHNPKVQQVRQLLSRRGASLFVAEGVRLVEEALRAGWQAELALFSQSLSPRGQALSEKIASQGCPVEELSTDLMEWVSDTETPQGILAVFQRRELPLPAALDFALVVDSVRDPGNLGTLLRSAAAVGVQAVLLAPGTSDAFSPKVLRAGMGAHFRLALREAGWDEIEAILKRRSPPLAVYLAEAGEGIPCWQADLRRPLALLAGGEAEGASKPGRRLADAAVTIPMPGGSESLNAGVAASILLYEIMRQRSL